jgi:hypothetical protein
VGGTTCGYCEVSCPIQLEHLPKFYRLRQRQVMMDGVFPHELNRVFAAYESQSNPWGLDATTRGDWAKDLGLPIVSSADEVAQLDYLYSVGSASSFDPRGQKIARAFVRVAEAAGIRLGILGPLEGSTGECVAGSATRWSSSSSPARWWKRSTASASAASSRPIRTRSTSEERVFRSSAAATSHPSLQAIDEWLRDGRCVDRTHERIIYHEPLPRAAQREYEAPRRVLQAVSRDTPLEFELSRDMRCAAERRRPHVA